ncbi:SIR2 family NAD-dependent protein deacylase [Fimbriimonas ginsengisoli]|uniref:protein acetyllysine N-acetyltransferase n=1 Tax=Fimbriimonas ginsengisoli Gsoil 348 TaxID=661478 RepID=A0A068NQ54_FIMGI|nr:Sir2 family NAD-dependent protein deacetylase [Fimbriimonas ginsengisoli]AIE85683.1 NAD-dependent protein deacetylase of SIR2 family [Fimbriimonas ginsengisoli Gsoil 348]
MKIVVFTGAGVSRESGLLTFRDSEDGLWNGYSIHEVASMKGWWADPAKVLDFYNMRRREARQAEPNDAHRAIAELEKDHDVTVITQNVDDLHERAGSTNVIHLHGELFKVRAIDEEETNTLPWVDDLVLGDVHPEKGTQLRPHVVWFGEGLPELDRAMKIALDPGVDVLIVVGTTLTVYPAALIATETNAWHVFVVDPNPPELMLANVRYIREPATYGMKLVTEAIKALPLYEEHWEGEAALESGGPGAY